jgi:hypothetical protein
MDPAPEVEAVDLPPTIYYGPAFVLSNVWWQRMSFLGRSGIVIVDVPLGSARGDGTVDPGHC